MLPRNTLFNLANNDDWKSLKQQGFYSFYYGQEKEPYFTQASRFDEPRQPKQEDIGYCFDKYESIAMGGTEEWKAKSSGIDWRRCGNGINLQQKSIDSQKSLPK